MPGESNERKERRLQIATMILAGHCAKDGMPQTDGDVASFVGKALIIANDLIIKNSQFDGLIFHNQPIQGDWNVLEKDSQTLLSAIIETLSKWKKALEEFEPGDKPYSLMSERTLKETIYPENEKPELYVLKSRSDDDPMPCRFSADEAKNVAAQWNNNNPGNKVIVVSAQVPLEQALFDQRSAAAIVEENLFRNGTVFADLKK